MSQDINAEYAPRSNNNNQYYPRSNDQNRNYNPKFQNSEVRSAGHNNNYNNNNTPRPNSQYPPRNNNYNNQNNNQQPRPYYNNRNNNDNNGNNYNNNRDNNPRPYNNNNNRNYNNNPQQQFYNQRPTKYDRYSNYEVQPGQEEFHGYSYDTRYFPRNFSEIKNCNDETLMGWFKFLPYSEYTERQEQLLLAVVNECRIRYGVEI